MATIWLHLWDSPEYQEFVSVHSKIVRSNAVDKLLTCDTIAFREELTGDEYHVTFPVYGEAHEALEHERDPIKRADIENYIRHMKMTHAVAHRAVRTERTRASFKDKMSHMEKHGLLDIMPPSTDHVYYIKQLPKVTLVGKYDGKTEPSSKVKAAPKRRVVRKPKLSVQTRDRIKENTLEKILSKSLIDTFPFKKESECVSRATSAKYYISKKDLTEIIKKNPKLIERVGKNYATLKKEDICAKLFDK